MNLEDAHPDPSIDLDKKYKNLLGKIKKSCFSDDEEASDGYNEDEENDQLKALYDKSVLFKNDLSQLRSGIKSLNQ